ncbi:Uu.00g088250.m01.CDS01 [Anthostomella pinea]|uniref:Uu.00g088250.m01.CDS01 n=1 Tax=Anthostomella pinea TaxID=933095 RepID=A0AAI8VMI6_9PEZI|nr:Uu.00g088250.m01.CDS01 [Anthostomella pinea]
MDAARAFKLDSRPSAVTNRPSSGGRSPSPTGFGGLYSLRDPRASSAQSLTPSLPEYEEIERRTLLIIYIHGFMGNDSSFQSFPAHVHKYLKLALADTHHIHTKIYPKYKTYKAIDVARDNFSKWLEPHESPKTDVILVGHSMGGLLAADVALMPSADQVDHRYLRHRILGTVNLDAPLLGLHPGIIVSGISSLFRKIEPPKPPGEPAFQPRSSQAASGITSPTESTYSRPSMASEMSLASPTSPGQFAPPASTLDPYFNPAFPNDVRREDRPWWKNVVHFVQKHNSEGLIDAASHHIMSHLEFGSCLMDLNGLKTRYENIRKLEDVDDLKHYGFPHVPPQVRFIQYYTICHGYPKKPKTQNPEKEEDSLKSKTNVSSEAATPGIFTEDPINTATNQPISTEDHSNDHNRDSKPLNSFDATHKEGLAPLDESDGSRSSMEMLDPAPMLDETEHPDSTGTAGVTDQPPEKDSPPVEPEPQSVQAVDEDPNTDTIDAKPPEGASLMERSSTVDKATTAELTDAVTDLDLDLPTIPELPPRPELPNLEQYTDKDARKQAEKEGKRVQKAYDQSVKNREKAIKERQKIIDKRKKKRAQEAEKRQKEAQKQRQKDEAAATAAVAAAMKHEASLPENTPGTTQSAAALSQQMSGASLDDSSLMSPESRALTDQQDKTKPPKKMKDRKFINVPKVNGEVDPKWVRIFMKDIDETGAHTGLFFSGEHYEKLVGDVGDTIVKWVHEDMTKRAILEIGVD